MTACSFRKCSVNEILYHEKLTVREFLREPVFGGSKRREELGAEQPGIDSGEFEKPYLTEREGKKTGVQDSFGEKAPEADQVQEGDILLRNGKMIRGSAIRKHPAISIEVFYVSEQGKTSCCRKFCMLISVCRESEKNYIRIEKQGIPENARFGGRIGENETPLFYVGETKRIRDFS